MGDIIGQLLRAGLLINLGEDQERAGRLRAASQHLRDGLLGDARADIASALLAAADEDGPADVPILKAARAAIVDEWEMFENAYVQQDPSSILRAVTLDAVVGATEADPQVAAAVWYTLRNTAGMISAGRWAQPIADFQVDLDTMVSQHINEAWEPTARSSSLNMPPVAEATKVQKKIGVKGLAEFRTAVEQQGVDHALSHQFPAILEHLLTAVAQHTQSADAAETERLKSVVSTLGGRLRQILATNEQLLTAVARRETLLWWRLGGRSNLLGTRYREAPNAATAVVAAAFDLHRCVPDTAPEAVEHLLVDVLDEAGLSGEPVTVDAMAAACSQLQLTTPTDASAPLLVVDVVAGGGDRDELARPFRGPMTTPEAAATLFRDLQIRRLLASEPDG